MKNRVSPWATGFMIIGALCGASFASGQEILKFFCSYGKTAFVAFPICFLLYLSLGRVAFYISRKRNTDKIEEIVAPSDNRYVKLLCQIVVLFCFFVIMTSLLAAGDAVSVERLGIPKGIGGLVITVLVILTNIVGLRGIQKVVPKVVPIIVAMMLTTTILVPTTTDRVEFSDPTVFSSPLAPMWIIGAILYLSYNFLASIPVISTLPKEPEEVSSSKKGMLIGFGGICIMGILISITILMDVGNAGQYELPMVYLAGKVSPILAIAYSCILVIAIYCSSSNCLFALTKGLREDKKLRRILIIIAVGMIEYFISLAGFSTLVTYVSPVMGYSCIIVLVLLIISFAMERFSGESQDDIEI